MWRFLFLIYCLAAWESFLFQPLLSINLLMVGLVIYGLHCEWRARPRGLAADRT